jgi:hypothetical protein
MDDPSGRDEDPTGQKNTDDGSRPTGGPIEPGASTPTPTEIAYNACTSLRELRDRLAAMEGANSTRALTETEEALEATNRAIAFLTEAGTETEIKRGDE